MLFVLSSGAFVSQEPLTVLGNIHRNHFLFGRSELETLYSNYFIP